jgi:Xaa-Pro aminopeptidase
MADASVYPTFSEAEFARRHQAVRAILNEEGAAALVVFGAGRNLEIQYLTNWPGSREAYLIFPAAGELSMFVQLYNHLPNARRMAIVEDVRWGGTSSAESVVANLRERGIERGRVGLVGAVPYQHHARLQKGLPQVELVDLTQRLRAVETVKSDEEIERLRTAARFTDLAMRALEREVRPGLREDQLAAIVEGAYADQGGWHGIHFMATTPMRAPAIGVPSQVQSFRVIQPGDVLITEISAGYWGYTGQIHRAYAIGEPPTPEYQRLHAAGVEAFERIREVLRDGATVEDVLDAAEVIHQRDYTIYDDLLHGASQFPPILQTRSVARGPIAPFTFRENMVVVVQPNVITESEGRMGLQVGETLRITRTGTERLHDYPMEFVVCRG